MSDPVFLLLKEGLGWVQEKFLWDVLGAVVKNYLSPGDDAIPQDTLRFSRGVDEVVLDHFVLGRDGMRSKETSLTFPGVFDLRGKRENVKKLSLSGKRILVKRLRRQGSFWTEMTEAEPDIKTTVGHWMSEKKNMFGRPRAKVFWVTGVLLCQDVHIAASDADGKELHRRGELPIGTCAQLAAQAAIACPLPVDLSALPNVIGERSALTSESQCFAAQAESTYIFGLRLRQVVLTKKDGADQLSPGAVDMKLPKGRQLNDSDSEEESFILETAELDDEDWNAILTKDENPYFSKTRPEASVVDIVFIHGLTGDREKTWTAKNATRSWPEALLPGKIPNACILAFGYDADVTDWRGLVSKNTIANHATNLITTLATYREENDTNDRPLFFVCHSLGGLVCEDALVTARQRPERHLLNILECTRGILFIGTPHHGLGLASWAEQLARSLGLIKQTNPQIVEVLRSDSEVLARIQDSFHTMIRARNQAGGAPIEITCFYEELPLVGIDVVVPSHSAILPGYVPIGIHANHMDMTKFDGPEDPGFKAVTGKLKRWVRAQARAGATHKRSRS